MTSNVATRVEGKVARPLRVLVPLIKDDLEAAEEAGTPYYRAAGAKFLEARDGSFEGRLTEFYDWAQRNFEKSKFQVKSYMNLVLTETKEGRHFNSLQSSESHRLGRDLSPRMRPRAWHEDVQGNIERAKREAERIREESLTRQQEREAEQRLALRLIDIGYKVLAKELHPDRGGSRDAMQRLGRVRDRLKQHV